MSRDLAYDHPPLRAYIALRSFTKRQAQELLTVVVILFLVVLWAIVLGPSLYRHWSDGRVVDSVGAFHRHLRVLRRTGPDEQVPAANILTTSGDRFPSYGPLPPPARSVPVVQAARPMHSRSGETFRVADTVAASYSGVSSPPRDVRRGHSFGGPARRSGREVTLRRRRDALTFLGVSLTGCLALGALPPLRPVWYVAAAIGAAMVAYVALLLRFEVNASERREKVVRLPQDHTREINRALRPSSYIVVGDSVSAAPGPWEDGGSVVVVSAAGGA